MNYDLVVLGGGPGGYKAALKGALNRLKTALVESAQLGGTCLNRGCVPTKLFLGATSVISQLDNQKKLRLARGNAVFDLASLQIRKKSVISASQKAMRASLEKNGVDIFMDKGRLEGGKSVLAGSQKLHYNKLILATGSKSGFPRHLKPDHHNILTSTHALELSAPPQSLTVIGAGPVGLEMGQIFHRLGTRINLIEAMDRIAPMEDEQVSLELSRYLKRQGWNIITGSKVVKLSNNNNQLEVHLDNGQSVETQKCLLALGRRANTDELNLEAAGIEIYGSGWIKTSENLMASADIYAIGDVNGRTMYAHAAAHQAEYVLDHILGRTDASYPDNPPPACIYGSMEVIRTGLTQKELVLKGLPFSVSSASLASNPIVQGHGQIQGFIKVFWSDDRVMGITGTGYAVSGLITLAQIIIHEKWTREDAQKYIFAHPTVDETLQEALLAPRSIIGVQI
jgi:dihydrolipoamide dehydrogenase